MNRIFASVMAAAMCLSVAGAPLTALAQAPTGAPSPTATPAAPAPAGTATPTTAEAPKPAVKPATTTETVENPYGLKALWEQSDWVAKATLLILVFMSIGTWYILVAKLIELNKIARQAKQVERDFWSASDLNQGLSMLKEHSPFRFIAEAGLEATKKHEGLLGQISFSDWVTQSIQRAVDAVQSNLQNGLAFLASVGSTAPFVGLFGTVWGIYHALVKIGVSGQASIDKVAGPVGEALIMTAIGLAVAVPAVLAYNYIVRKNKITMEKVRGFGSDLHSVLIASAAKR
ncbi:MAG: MotA/TolQ/ExbB proton channel family protein [Casimicrobiaceae bacterium]|nr:MotA/TolQ/ExbB proton channel family protein [Casimicrobiaceae bacterium]